jgi:Domain of unknown function (DUF4359)
MTNWQILPLNMALILCGLGGIMALTNPDRSAYETYASEKIGELAKDQCNLAPAELGVILQAPCRATIEAFKPHTIATIAATTTRQNAIFFSIYRSDISIPIANFHAKVESIGILNNFWTYKLP